MALPPVIGYDAYIISGGVDLSISGAGTPNLSATYSDVGYVPDAAGTKANCSLGIQYSNIDYTINDDNSITVTGTISGGVLTRTATGQPSVCQQRIQTWLGTAIKFDQTVETDSSGTYNLNIAGDFSVTVPPSINPQPQRPASIRYKNDNLQSPNPWDEFYLGLVITNPNPPNYRPGMEWSCVTNQWESVNQSTGKAKEFTGATCTDLSDIKAISPGQPAAKTEGAAAFFWDCKNNRWSNQFKVGHNQ